MYGLNGENNLMEMNGIQNVSLSDSYILGWKQNKSEFILYLYVLLQDTHPNFQPYDEKSEFGCYKNAHIVFKEVSTVKGLSEKELEPQWDTFLNEYKDVAEINDIVISGNNFYIETDEWILHVTANEYILEVNSVNP